MNDEACEVYRNTPDMSVRDSRGFSIRELVLHRHPETPQMTEALITRHSIDSRGFLASSADPLLSRAELFNVIGRYDLQGNAVRWQSVDSGTCIQLADSAGKPLLRVDQIATPEVSADDHSHAVSHYWHYEQLGLPGRLVAMVEQTAGEHSRCAERHVYAGPGPLHKQRNLAGKSMLHYDTAGQMETCSVALSGVPLGVRRRLLADSDDVGVLVDWQGEDMAIWDSLLVPELQGHVTVSTVDAVGSPLTHEDAAGHVQRMAYDLAGQLAATWLKLQGGVEQPVVKALNYGAAGQKLNEAHGNGLSTRHRFAPLSNRLVAITTIRGAELTVLLDLAYAYDPAGNVLSVVNASEPTRFWHGQKIEARNLYVYNSLYQLVRASGREMANARRSRAVHAFVAFDHATYSQYARSYHYDLAGNLTKVRHSGPASGNSYTTDITVSDRSNRAVLGVLTENPLEVEDMFTAGGLQKLLNPGQRLLWTPRGELQQVSPVTREGEDDDFEGYRYAGDRQRVLKVSSRRTSGSWQGQRTLYLPGLELRSMSTGGGLTEDLQVIAIGRSGRAQVRVLHWVSGKPEGIENDQVRYSYDDLVGSSGLEVDGRGEIISCEEYYPYGGTAVFIGRNQVEVNYKVLRYSGKEQDATGLYYYGYRYYQPWIGRWLSADPEGQIDGLNLYSMVRNNPTSAVDSDGRMLDELIGYFSRDSASPILREFEEFMRSRDNGTAHQLDAETRDRDAELLERLARHSNDSAALMEYTEGGNGIYQWVNSVMRGVRTLEQAEQNFPGIADTINQLKSEVSQLSNFDGVAYRMLMVPSGIYGNRIRVGDVIVDGGFMSASALPRNTGGWRDWARALEGAPTDTLALVLDQSTPKKMAPTTILADHILVEPNTPLKVKEIRIGEGMASPMIMVRVKAADHPFRHALKNAYSGAVVLERGSTRMGDILRRVF